MLRVTYPTSIMLAYPFQLSSLLVVFARFMLCLQRVPVVWENMNLSCKLSKLTHRIALLLTLTLTLTYGSGAHFSIHTSLSFQFTSPCCKPLKIRTTPLTYYGNQAGK